MKKYLLSLLTLTLLLCEASFTGGGMAFADASGSCGDSGVTWSYTTSNHTLTISYSGTGSAVMPDYGASNMPWNSYKSNITSIVINSGVTTLGNNAFYNCTNVTSVTIANTVTKVNSYAFQNLSKLTTISIPSSIKYFGSGAFSGCTKLTEVKYASSATNWANIDFAGSTANPIYYAKGLKCNNSSTLTTSISYLGSATVHKIKQYTFYNDTAITSLSFSSSVDTIDTYAFYGCNKITSKMEIPAVKYLGASAFSGCSSLTEFYVALQAPLTSYPSSLLYNCTSLTKVYIPRNVSSLGANCFYNCSSLQYIYSSNLNAPTVGSNAFYNVPSSTQVKVLTSAASSNYKAVSAWNSKFSSIGYFSSITTGSHTLTILSYDHDNSKIFVSAKYNTSKPALSGDITLPRSSLQTGGVFYQYTYVPTTIVNNGYKDCTGITSVTIGNSYTTIGANAFSGCTELATVKFGSGSSSSSQCNISSIGNDAFTSCSKVANVYCYGGIAKWLNITFGNAIANPFYASSVSRTFYLNSTAASSISIPAGTTAIKNYAFYKNSTITSVEIPSSVTSFGTDAFYNCSNITSVNYLGENATAWANITFPGKSANPVNYSRQLNIGGTPLTDCYINGDVKQYAFYNDSLLTSVSFGSSVTSLGAQAFENCKNIETLDMSEASSLATIGYSVFDGCGKISGDLYIPATVTSIGQYTFNDCSKVTAFYVMPTSIPTVTNANTFTSMVKTIPFYVSSPSALTLYAGASYWNAFTNRKIGGFCGAADNETGVKWEFNTTSGLLTISGSGAMKDYNNSTNRAPWYDFRASVLSIKVCDNVTHIGKYAFQNCSSATSTWITTTVTSIGASAFNGCEGLTEVKYGKTGTATLSYAADWAKITFGNGTANPLYYGHTLHIYKTGYTVPEFKVASSIESGRSLTEVKAYAFWNCTSLTTAHVPAGVTTIKQYAFYGCSNLCDVTFPNELEKIEQYAFNSCTFSSITIPENVTNIVCCSNGTAYNIFSGCNSLTTIVWNARNCSSTFAKIGKGANQFDYATPFESVKTQITSITFGENVERIPNYLCHGMTSLTSVTIPASVTNIGTEAFDACSSTMSVTCESTTPPTLASGAFSSPSTKKLYLPHNIAAKAAYRAASGWSSFTEANTFPKIVQFSLNGKSGNAIDPQFFDNLTTKASVPSNPSAAPFTFNGWYENAEGTGSEFAFSTTNITADKTLYAKWTLNDLELDEDNNNNSLIAAYNGLTTNVTMTRSLTNAQYNTFCLPFSLNASQMATAFGEGYDLEELTDVTYDGDVLGLVFTQRSELEAGKPYLLQPANAVVDPSFSDVEIDASTPSDGLNNTYLEFHGIYSPTSLTGGNKNLLFLGAGNELFWPAATASMKGFRAYFEIKSPAQGAIRARIVKKQDAVTGIEEVRSENANAVRSEKILRNGQLLILREGKTYNAQGMLVE